MHLHFAPRTHATRARWILEELEVPYELVLATPAPVLIDGPTVLTEPLAIALYLGDRFPEKALAPQIGDAERGAYLQWLTFAEVTLSPLDVRLDEALAVLAERLRGREVIVGARFSVADVSTASILHRVHAMKRLEAHPGLTEYVMRHTRRPAVRRAL